PRTQSALLEAMNEQQATVEGQSYPLASPFLVLATQNPVEYHGTYPLPEAQLDRFLLRLSLGYPEQAVEVEILHNQAIHHPLESIQPVVDCSEVVAIQNQARQVRVEQSVSEYIVRLVAATRSDSRLKLGVSPRGSIMLFRAAQAAALTDGRDYVLPDDVQSLAGAVLAHRLILTSKSKYGGSDRNDIVGDLLEQVKVPT
ncbi:MAG: AAA family ATPase, partial [Planctomycetota bacterium]